MNIFIPLLIGLLVGYIGKGYLSKSRRWLDILISLSLLALIFFMGVEAGKVKISASWLFGASVLFAILAILGSLTFATILRRLIK